MKVRASSILVAMIALMAAQSACSKGHKSDYPISAAPLTYVHFTGGFWAGRQETDIKVTIDHEMRECEETGRIRNFELAAAALRGKGDGKFSTRYAFDDSDVYKVIEAASYVLMLKPDAALEKRLDQWIEKITAAQEPDGYLYTARTIDPQNPPEMSGPERWVKLRDSHELYNLGHLYEAAVAHHQATGKRSLLDVAIKSAKLVRRTFGPGADQLKKVPGHEEIELALVKLYRLTGDQDYLDLAKFFIDQRGNAAGHELYGAYNQDHEPVLEQREAVGHSVRAAYLYSAMSDLAALSGDPRYMQALESIWQDVVSKKLYLTGGIGAAGHIEGFGPAYDLPNPTGYAETCATIGYALWNWRMFLYHGDGKYMDLFERAVYNAFLSGAGLSGDRFFYPNPLASFGQHERSGWFTCACCPPNVARFIAEMGSFVYGLEGNHLYVNLYAQSRATLRTQAGQLDLEQKTDYPWNGKIQIRIAPRLAAGFSVSLRIPGWARGRPLPGDLYSYTGGDGERISLSINGESVPVNVEKGYATIQRTWRPAGDIVELSLPMAIHRVRANENVKSDVGRVAVERGPLVYCAEWPDNGGRVSNLVLDGESSLVNEESLAPPQAMTRILGRALALGRIHGRLASEKRDLTLIPYYAWAHRGPGEMEVWIASEPGKARPAVPPDLSAKASVTASEGAVRVHAVNDQYEPESSDDPVGYVHWWPHKGTAEWVQYDFGQAVTVSETSVYWFDDTGSGQCRVPASWHVLYRTGNKWMPIRNYDPYGTAKDRYNNVRFSPVRTDELRLLLQLPEKFSSGVQEWKVVGTAGPR